MMLVWLGGLLVVMLLFVAYMGGLFQKSYPNSPPIVTAGIPILGTFMGFAKSPVGFIRQAYDNFGSVFTMRMFGQRLTFLIGPEAHTPFFRAPDTDASQAEVYKFMTPVFGRGIVYDAPTKLRMQQMKFVASSLKATQLRTYIPKIIAETEQYLGKWGSKGQKNLLEAMSELTILTASRTLMGKEIRETLFEQVAALYADLDAGITPLSVFFPNAPTPAHRTRNAARKEMGRIFANVIRNRRQTGEVHDDCLQAFMDCRYKDGTALSDDSITGLMVALLFAGQHTSSITTTWTVLYILHNPEIYAQVMAEQESVLGSLSADAPLSWDALTQFNVLHRCMKEAIRMWPPLIFLMRKLKTDMKVGGHVIPAGDTIMAAPSVSMMLPGVFKNPETFDPDRYLPPRSEDARPFSYVGFGGGMHGCMGEQFAYLQVKTIASILLRSYDLKPVASKPPVANYKAMVVGPESNQTEVTFVKRQ